MKLLAIETSSDCGTIALQSDGEIFSAELTAVREQSARIIPMIDALLEGAGLTLRMLDAIAFGRGPGSFTGVRLAASVAQGLGTAADLGLLAVSSLAALAQQVERREGVGRVLACIDARMGEVYWGEYAASSGRVRLIGREALSQPGAVICPTVSPWVAVGDGFARYAEALGEPVRQAALTRADWHPAAVDLLMLAAAALERGEAVAAEHCALAYLRDATAWEARD